MPGSDVGCTRAQRRRIQLLLSGLPLIGTALSNNYHNTCSKKVLDRRVGGDTMPTGALAPVYFSCDVFSRFGGRLCKSHHTFCEGACLRFWGRRVLPARAFQLRLRPAISVTRHPAARHVAIAMRGRPVMGTARTSRVKSVTVGRSVLSMSFGAPALSLWREPLCVAALRWSTPQNLIRQANVQ